MLVIKEELVTDLKILLYCCTDEVEKLTKIKEHANVQLVQCMQQIKVMAPEKDLCDKELAELKATAQAIVVMVDMPEEGAKVSKTLLERC